MCLSLWLLKGRTFIYNLVLEQLSPFGRTRPSCDCSLCYTASPFAPPQAGHHPACCNPAEFQSRCHSASPDEKKVSSNQFKHFVMQVMPQGLSRTICITIYQTKGHTPGHQGSHLLHCSIGHHARRAIWSAGPVGFWSSPSQHRRPTRRQAGGAEPFSSDPTSTHHCLGCPDEGGLSCVGGWTSFCEEFVPLFSLLQPPVTTRKSGWDCWKFTVTRSGKMTSGMDERGAC